MGDSIEEILLQPKENLFVLVLDELDSLFLDKRGKPSDFVYNLVVLEEKLHEKGFMMCIVGISNNVMTEFDLDDRVRSRIGSYEIFFEAYTKKNVLAILRDRTKEAKPLTYRCVSELLVELQNIGIAISQTASKGRHGYGTQYRLTISPEAVGMILLISGIV